MEMTLGANLGTSHSLQQSKAAGDRPNQQGERRLIVFTMDILGCASKEVLTKPSKEQEQ